MYIQYTSALLPFSDIIDEVLLSDFGRRLFHSDRVVILMF